MMLGCESREAMRASSRNIATNSLFRPCSARITFSAAKVFGASVVRPSQTLAIPPSEMGASTVYSPSRSNGRPACGVPDILAILHPRTRAAAVQTPPGSIWGGPPQGYARAPVSQLPRRAPAS